MWKTLMTCFTVILLMTSVQPALAKNTDAEARVALCTFAKEAGETMMQHRINGMSHAEFKAKIGNSKNNTGLKGLKEWTLSIGYIVWNDPTYTGIPDIDIPYIGMIIYGQCMKSLTE